MAVLKETVGKLQPVLEEYATEKANIEQQLMSKGIIPITICERCSRRTIVRVSKLNDGSQKSVASLLNWMQENDTTDLESNGEILAFKSTKKTVEGVQGSIPLVTIGSTLKSSAEKISYDYKMSTSRLKRKPFSRLLDFPFATFRTCSHLTKDNLQNKSSPVLLTHKAEYPFIERSHKVEKMWQEEEPQNELRLLCGECVNRIDSIGCEDSIRKEGFVYRYSFCPLSRVLLEQLLEKHKIEYVAPQEENSYRDGFIFHLPEYGVVLTGSYREIESTIQAVKPECVVAFGAKQELVRYLGLGVNVIVFDEQAANDRFTILDREVKVEQSIENIIQTIVEKLDQYSSEVRGKEHDRLIAAFQKIGRELGFIAQQELSQKGARVDVVWLNREGGVDVAIEVQVSAQWKKDIVTTWETGPKLAVVLTHYKTDKALTDVIQYNLLQYMPHKLLLINYSLKKAYLLEKQEIIRAYDLKTAT